VSSALTRLARIECEAARLDNIFIFDDFILIVVNDVHRVIRRRRRHRRASRLGRRLCLWRSFLPLRVVSFRCRSSLQLLRLLVLFGFLLLFRLGFLVSVRVVLSRLAGLVSAFVAKIKLVRVVDGHRLGRRLRELLRSVSQLSVKIEH